MGMMLPGRKKYFFRRISDFQTEYVLATNFIQNFLNTVAFFDSDIKWQHYGICVLTRPIV